jgi:hypothetical protein
MRLRAWLAVFGSVSESACGLAGVVLTLCNA